MSSVPAVMLVSPYLWDDALLFLLLAPHHGVGLAGSCLAIGEYADIVALEGVLEHLLPDVAVHLPLRRVLGVRGLWGEGTAVEAAGRQGPESWSTKMGLWCVSWGLRGTGSGLLPPRWPGSPRCVTSRNSQS